VLCNSGIAHVLFTCSIELILLASSAGADTGWGMQGMHPPTRLEVVLTWHLISLKIITKNIFVLYIT